MMVEFSSISETEKWAKEFAQQFRRPCLVLLDGDLGAGKTQLVKWFVEALGGTPASSPTFAVHQAYESPGGTLDHVDLYRLENQADLESTGFWDLLGSDQALVFVEWTSKLPDSVWPAGMKRFKIELHKTAVSTEGRRVELNIIESHSRSG